MRRIVQPLLTVIRWCICHCELGRRFTKFYKTTRDTWRRKKAYRRLQRHGWEILSRVRMALDKTDAGYFVDYGTLLGLTRDGGFIKHDDDVDFSLPDGKLSPQTLLNIMLQNGFTFKRAFLWNGHITEITFLWKKIEVDFFYVFSGDDGRNFSLAYDHFVTEDGLHIAKMIIRGEKPDCIGTTIKRIHDIDVPMPLVAKEFLEFSYGAGWRLPSKNYQLAEGAHHKRLEGSAKMFVSLDDIKEYFSPVA